MTTPPNIGTVWEDRHSGQRVEVEGVRGTKIQVAPLEGENGYRIMTAKSLRSNYQMVATDKKKLEPPSPPYYDLAEQEAGVTEGIIEAKEREQELQAAIDEGEAETREAQESARQSIEADDAEHDFKLFQEANCTGCFYSDPDKIGSDNPCCTYPGGLEVKEGKCLKRKVRTEPIAPPAPATSEERKARATVGRVKMPDGTVIAGSKFITEVCGKTRDESYKVDSPIRWLKKPAGQELLKDKGAIIVYGSHVS